MSKIGNVIQDVQERLLSTNDSYEEIAKSVGVSVQWVREIAEDLEDYSPYQTLNS